MEEEIILIPEITRMEVVSITEGKEIPVEEPEQAPTAEERITALEQENAMLMECILEMSEYVYA